jgi:hypothetical protein
LGSEESVEHRRSSKTDRRCLKFLSPKVVISLLLIFGVAVAMPAIAPYDLQVNAVATTSYVVSADGTTISALNTVTGKVDFSGTDAAAIIMSAAVANSKVLIKAGTYIINHPDTSGIKISNSNVELYGEGQTVTILRLADGANSKVIDFSQTSNDYMHDLQIDGNRLNQAQGTGSPATSMSGVVGWESTGLVIANNYVHDVRDMGIDLVACTSSQVLNNLVVNSDANGITIDNQEGGSGITVSGNTVDGASDVGITAWYGNGVTASGNTIRNIMMNTSPYSSSNGGTHVGMMVEVDSNQVTFSGNQINNVGTGLSTGGGTATTVLYDSNTVTNCGQALYSEGVDGLKVTNNMFSGIAQSQGTKTYWSAITIESSDTGSNIITGNQFRSIGPYLASGYVARLFAPSGTFSDNTLETDGGLYQPYTTNGGWTIQNSSTTMTTSASSSTIATTQTSPNTTTITMSSTTTAQTTPITSSSTTTSPTSSTQVGVTTAGVVAPTSTNTTSTSQTTASSSSTSTSSTTTSTPATTSPSTITSPTSTQSTSSSTSSSSTTVSHISSTTTTTSTSSSTTARTRTSTSVSAASVSSYSIAATVNVRMVSTVTVYILQAGKVIASQKYTYTASAKSHTFTFTGLAAGTYTVVVQVNMRFQQTKTVTLPPNARVTFNF